MREWETITIPLNATFEHAIFVLEGDVVVDGKPLEKETLHYLGIGLDELELKGRDARILLIGGEPFRERDARILLIGGEPFPERS